MANIYEPAYVANLAVRNLLSEVGRKKAHNSSRNSREWIKFIGVAWKKIMEQFEHKCAYCGQKGELQKDHLIQHNKGRCGLHHPGNIIPSCKSCNNRDTKEEWETKLEKICAEKGEESLFKRRRKRIIEHHGNGEYKYPKLSSRERKKLGKVANSLYEKIKNDIEESMRDLRDFEA